MSNKNYYLINRVSRVSNIYIYKKVRISIICMEESVGNKFIYHLLLCRRHFKKNLSKNIINKLFIVIYPNHNTIKVDNKVQITTEILNRWVPITYIDLNNRKLNVIEFNDFIRQIN